MKTFPHKLLLLSMMIFLLGSVLFSFPGKVYPAYLQWASTPLTTESVKVGFGHAQHAMRSLNYQNIRRTTNEVTGLRGGVYAAITIIATTPRVTAVVMVVGDNAAETAKARDDLRDKIKKTVLID